MMEKRVGMIGEDCSDGYGGKVSCTEERARSVFVGCDVVVTSSLRSLAPPHLLHGDPHGSRCGLNKVQSLQIRPAPRIETINPHDSTTQRDPLNVSCSVLHDKLDDRALLELTNATGGLDPLVMTLEEHAELLLGLEQNAVPASAAVGVGGGGLDSGGGVEHRWVRHLHYTVVRSVVVGTLVIAHGRQVEVFACLSVEGASYGETLGLYYGRLGGGEKILEVSVGLTAGGGIAGGEGGGGGGVERGEGGGSLLLLLMLCAWATSIETNTHTDAYTTTITTTTSKYTFELRRCL